MIGTAVWKGVRQSIYCRVGNNVDDAITSHPIRYGHISIMRETRLIREIDSIVDARIRFSFTKA